MIVAIHQPNFIPWLGYFYKISNCDTFIFLDDVQYPKQSPASRNYIKNKKGEKQLLSVPVKLSKGAFQNYNEIEIDYSQPWNRKLLNLVKDAYLKAPFFKTLFPQLEGILLKEHQNLAELNLEIIYWCLYLLDMSDIKTIRASQIATTVDSKNDRNIALCESVGATIYLSGAGGKNYNDTDAYKAKNIELRYSDFEPKQYPQLHGEFISNLSVIDALFNIGGSEISKQLKLPV